MSKEKQRFTPFKPGADHILYGKPAWNKGKKMPHSKEWEEKRIAAVRAAAAKRIYAKGYSRPVEHTSAMRDAVRRWVSENPERAKEISLTNLSRKKNGILSGEGSPRWKGGISKASRAWRNRHWKELAVQRDAAFARHPACSSCGSTEDLELHHIIPISECRSTAFLEMNGILLCGPCHRQTDNFGAKATRKFDSSFIPKGFSSIVRTIPHNWQVYNTIGNYDVTKDGIIVIFVSDLGYDLYEILVAIHELIEVSLCLYRGITIESVTQFDINFENSLSSGYDEPGDDPSAPYYIEHQFATLIEKKIAAECDLNWDEYTLICNTVSDTYNR